MKTQFAILLSAAALLQSAQGWSAPAEHWVATWTTGQQLVRPTGGGRGGPPPQAPPTSAAQSGAAAALARPPQAGRGPQSNIPATLGDQTVRMVVHTSLGGKRVRVQFSNAVGA